MDDNYSNGRKRGGTKEPLDEYEEASERASLRLDITKTKTMAPSPITTWQIEGGKVEVVTDFTLLASKITVDSYCSHEIKRHLEGKL